MQILLIFLILGSLAGIYMLYIKIQQIQKNSEKDKSQQILFNLIQDLRKTVSESQGQLSETVQRRLEATLDQVNKQMNTVNKSIDFKLAENTKVLGERLDNAAKVIFGVKKEMGQFGEISSHIKSLTDFLRHSKRRAGMGEQGLGELLAEAFPKEQYKMQYRFQNGEIVDAAIFTKNGIIPIDAKFPLENFREIVDAKNEEDEKKAKSVFRRDVKKHINDIAKKYIQPENGTLDFAFMYVPAESVHYESAINDDEISVYARNKHVYLVSPNGLYYVLRIFLLAFQSQRFEENAKKVLSMIEGVKQESGKFGESLSVLGRHVTNAKTKMDEVSSSFLQLDGKISQVTQVGGIKEKKRLKTEDDMEISKADIKMVKLKEGQKKMF